MFPSVLTYIIGKKHDKPALKVFLKEEDREVEKYFHQTFDKDIYDTEFVDVSKQMEERLQIAAPVKFEPEMDKETRKRLGEIIKKHSKKLMANHSHIIRISGGNMPEGTSDERKPCIVIHCLDKTLIPTGEQELPNQVEGYPVYIKEGFIMFGSCEGCTTLKNGCSIGIDEDKSAGSIGFFVKVRRRDQLLEERGFLTAAHVAFPNFKNISEANKLFTENDLRDHSNEIVHPSRCDSDIPTPIGRVSEAVWGYYGQNEIGIDAAFVKLYKEIGGTYHTYRHRCIHSFLIIHFTQKHIYV